ncbi:hypothetical protein [Pseudomonas koreensis]|uniref:hypothetical protein n=1 Tax=Pseudomonas koreensis TaxID=198620 RepID=UPI003821735E
MQRLSPDDSSGRLLAFKEKINDLLRNPALDGGVAIEQAKRHAARHDEARTSTTAYALQDTTS